MSKSKHTPEFRAKAAQEYLDGYGSIQHLANKYHVGYTTLREWINQYQIHGISAFITGNGNKKYSKELKIQCVEAVLSGEGSVDDIIVKYGISTRYVLRKWIMKYNANRELEDYNPKREVYMAEARRKTTIQERKEIVEYCIKHQRNYKDTASLYDVSYSQVYSWVKKYDANDDNALIDKRGHHKTDAGVDELERLRRENLRLKRQLEEKDMVTELLKKVKEFERM
ncbi:helix-turn-helix domain-containing protein [Robinsoniella peoriensis]|uniref:IS2 repressor TnpA n=1 Tax=Robinsoniella peoriensis TaxID=180332 RepID=A0A4V6HR82_9FIRM|nr:helix-turn-helix domain-containing protein [Robinsoniella peoriensis]MDU7031836.1 helix-turn-helix domain-containing protein [Clostridiales bacterium]TLC98027.1 IS2 repressor TnpA [Robinsoniella peoriensis]